MRWGWVTVLSALVGCTEAGLPQPAGDDATVADGGASVDAGTADGGTVDVGGPTCAPGQTDCEGTCVNTETDGTHCGACDHACTAGQRCANGICATGTCPTGMALIPGGTFRMGAADLALYSATPVHVVTLSAYCLDLTDVTVAAYGTCPSGTCAAPTTGSYCNWMVAGRENHPINCVNWEQSRAYCQWVHGGGGDLPTEAQWEYAASGGAMGWAYPWGNDAPLDQLCWSGGSAGGRPSTCPVMSFSTPANAFGLFDMAGNVCQWTGDNYGDYSPSAAVDPIGPTGRCTERVYRGGAWVDTDPTLVRAAVRNWDLPTNQNGAVGFRCARRF